MIPYYGEDFEVAITKGQAIALMRRRFDHIRLPKPGEYIVIERSILKAGAFETPVELSLMNVCGRYQLGSHSVLVRDWISQFNFNPNMRSGV
jgi:hypothetical protein